MLNIDSQFAAEEEEEEEEKEKVNFIDFEEYIQYMNTLSYECGKVINHKTVDTDIHYLFQDNQNPPRSQWVSGADNLTDDQVKAIEQYWILQRNVINCGIPRRPKEQIQIVQPIRIRKKSGKKKTFYAVQSPQLPLEVLQTDDFAYGLKGEDPLSSLINFLELEYFQI